MADNGGPTEGCDVQAYTDYREAGGDHLAAEQYGHAIATRNKCEVALGKLDPGDLVDKDDPALQYARVMERLYSQSTNIAKQLHDALQRAAKQTDEGDTW